MPAMRKVLNVTIGDWITEGEWHEDMQYHDTQYFIIAECADGKYVHEFYFLNNPEGAERFAQRVEDRGYIDLVYWGFHEFFSLSLEERLIAEAYHEGLYRGGYGHLSNGCYSGGHV